MLLTICFIVIIFGIFTYPKWSYKVWAKECEETVIPYTGRRRE